MKRPDSGGDALKWPQPGWLSRLLRITATALSRSPCPLHTPSPTLGPNDDLRGELPTLEVAAG